ncbi:MAG: hypothetical protein ACT4PT_10055 [Methanobacteriota archaeon]
MTSFADLRRLQLAELHEVAIQRFLLEALAWAQDDPEEAAVLEGAGVASARRRGQILDEMDRLRAEVAREDPERALRRALDALDEIQTLASDYFRATGGAVVEARSKRLFADLGADLDDRRAEVGRLLAVERLLGLGDAADGIRHPPRQ